MCLLCALQAGSVVNDDPELQAKIAEAEAKARRNNEIADYIMKDPELMNLNMMNGIESLLEWTEFGERYKDRLIGRAVISGLTLNPLFRAIRAANGGDDDFSPEVKADPAWPELQALIAAMNRRSDDLLAKAKERVDGPAVTQAEKVLEQVLSQSSNPE